MAAAPAGARGGEGGDARAQPLPRPDAARAPRSGSPSAPACRSDASPSATAPARSCWPRPRRCSSPAPRSSMPGRRSRCTRTSPRMTGARAVTVPLDAEGRHDLDAMAREVTAATRIVSSATRTTHRHRAAAAATGRLLARLPRARGRDRRRGVLRVPDSRGPDAVARPARPAPQSRAAADVLQGVRPLRPARRLRPVGSEDFRTAVDRVRQPFFVNAPAQARGGGGAPPPGRGGRARRAHSRSRLHVEDGRCAERRPRDRRQSRPTSSWVPLGERDEAEVVRGLAERGVHRARGRGPRAGEGGCE